MSTPISLLRSNPNSDPSSLSIIHNKNAKAIEDELNKLRHDLENIDISSTVTQSQFTTMLNNSKYYVLIRANMVNGEYIDFNEYRITRIGNPSGWNPEAIEFRVTDLNTSRNTDFRKSLIHIRDYFGYVVNPTILSESTFVSIIFSDVADMSPTNINPLSDTNNKRLLIF